MVRAEREAYLDGYRVGLGAAIRAIEAVRQSCGTDADDTRIVVAVTAVLDGLATGLRHISAGAVLAEDAP